MIVSKTPLRMSFVGGGSDLPAFYREEVGAVLSTSIDKYMYICVNKKFDGRIRVSYTRTEDVERRQQVEHPLVREALDLVGIDGGIEIASMADIPSKGSGLGSSSTYTVGLLNALYAYRNQFAPKEKLARQACEIEIHRCGEPIGKQDQYAAAYGGLNLIRFHPDDSVSVDPVMCKPALLQEMEDATLVFFTGRTRSASAVLANQSEAMKATDRRALMRRMVKLAFEMKEQLESGTLEHLGDLLDENWRLKAQLTAGISDPQIDAWYAAGMASGALGGKLLGAGNGGFIMFYAPPERHVTITAALADLQPVKFRFDRTGAQIVFYQPTE
ncbi:GHMP kinase [Pelomonas sp. Root1444]|uniref:GHMP family kinase ATP-binding protein n=1 Tax=Pelomonas sp. Root1444 TaxID=1736464 RepID=UPI000702FA9D|nr:GHMP kinase [Pelomonas sp. Root1444]KQY82815.1 GHMP kinase [Pelomonas sp. Root1444]